MEEQLIAGKQSMAGYGEAQSGQIETGPSATKVLKDVRLWGILALALGLALMASLPHLHEVTPRFRADDQNYHELAKTLLREGRFASTYRAPGYPVFVALIYSIFGAQPFAVYAVQSVLFVVSLVLIASIFEYVTGDRAVSLTSALACACYPLFYIGMVNAVLTETFALFLIALFLYLLQKNVVRPVWWMGIFLGVLFAAATLTKGVLWPFTVPIALCIFFLTGSRRAGIRGAALFLITVVVCLAPWTYRNWKKTGAFLPVSTGSGTVFWMGNYPGNYDSRLYSPDRAKQWPQLPGNLEAAAQGMTDIQRDNYLKGVAIGYILNDPVRAAEIFYRKFSILWLGSLGVAVDSYHPGTKPFLAVDGLAVTRTSLLLVPVLIMAVIGMYSLDDGRRRRALPVLFLLAWWTFSYVASIAVLRHGLPVYPYLLGFAAIPAVRAASVLLRRTVKS